MTDTPSSPASPDLTDADIRETEKVVASTVLKSNKGWDILRELYKEAAKKLLTTQGFTYPVLANRDKIDEHLSDPEGFRRSFNTLLSDLKAYKERLDGIWVKHKDESGTPTEAQWPVMFALSQEYSDTIDHFDQVIAPLIFSLVEVLTAEYSDLIELPTTDKE